MVYKKREIIYAELGLLILSIFAFAYLMREAGPLIPQASLEKNNNEFILRLIKLLMSPLKKPMIPLASAQEFGCCEETIDGSLCALSDESSCKPGALFAINALCLESSFCQKGCCYDEDAGIYDRNVLESLCTRDWISDPNCEVPGANRGCCVLGDLVKYETLGQCRIDTENLGISGGEVLDWRNELNEAQCLELSYSSDRGACVLEGRTCMVTTGKICLGLKGNFNPDFLCTSQALETDCKKTTQTTCLDGHDEVYFVDSCGNAANIYDSSKVNNPEYWEKIISKEDSCNADSKTGNAESKSCGNCNRFEGGICASANLDNFNPDYGQNYCGDVSCIYKGDVYENGASWCVYDGAVGNGDDVVGSRHWRYVCNQGDINVEPCADYRNEICVQSNTEEYGRVVFSNSQCIVNNWRSCLGLNSEEDGLEKCQNTLNCRIDRVEIGNKFSFDVCTPKYPGGFDLTDERFLATSESACGIATRTCQVIYKPKFFGGCKVKYNEGCLSEKFTQEMNDLCRGIADCGGEANINGEFVANYNLRTKRGTADNEAPDLSESGVGKLKDLANPRDNQIAEVENYSDFLEAAGISSSQGFDYDHLEGLGLGMGGLAMAGKFFLPSTAGSFVSGSVNSGLLASAASYASVAIGATMGFYAGVLIAKKMGLSPFGTYLMAMGGTIVGTAATFAYLDLAFSFISTGTLFWVGVILMVIGALFGGDDCDPDIVEFTCKPWLPQAGGDDCEKCNGDPLKPCSKYRCESLGASCELVNIGTEEEKCVDISPNDINPPVISPQLDVISPGQKYEDIEDGGFRIASEDSKCIDAYTPLRFGVNTNEPALCKFDLTQKEFSEMGYNFGSSFYLYNHTTQFTLPDINMGGPDSSSGDLEMYVKCQDSNGNMNSRFYVISICVNRGPDLNAPLILRVNPPNQNLISFDSAAVNVSVITNELSTCRWDVLDKEYSSMNNQFICNDPFGVPSGDIGYLCNAELETPENSNNYFIRCADQPGFIGTENESMINSNVESFEYTLSKPSSKIQIDSIFPNEDFKIATEVASFNIEVRTSGGGDVHHCSYSYRGFDKLIPFFETGTLKIHTQPSSPVPGLKTIYIECRDETGDFVRDQSTFEIVKDTDPPIISRVWQDGYEIFIITTEDAECKYATNSCSFDWGGGVPMGDSLVHTISSVAGQTYYVKCIDSFGNLPFGCSISVTST